MWKENIDINQIVEIRTRTNVFFGVGAIQKIFQIAEILKSKNINKVIVISGKNSYKSTGAWDVVQKALFEYKIDFINYDSVTPNPTTHQVDEAAKLAKDFGARAVIAIGGGSPIDAGKSVAILLEYPDNNASDLFEFNFSPQKAAPIIAINLTHGTGTETNRFAVVTIPEKNYKPAIAYDCIYPSFAIDDPALMTKLSPNQTKYVSIDAVNHVVEAATSKAASPFTVTLAKEVIDMVVEFLPEAIIDPQNLTARYFLAYASMIAGVCFDNGLLHYTHALEHPLSAVKPDLPHGLGLAILLPAVVKAIFNDKSKVLTYILAPLISNCENPSALSVAKDVQKWLQMVDVKEKLSDVGFSELDVNKLVNLAFETPSLSGLLSLAPSGTSKEIIQSIYVDSLTNL